MNKAVKYYKYFSLLALAFLYYLVCFVNPNKDFDIFIAASKLVQEGKSCYEVWLHSGTSGLKYFYSPLFAVLLFPINQTNQLTYNSIWFFCNLIFLARLFYIIRFYFPPRETSHKQILSLLSFLAVARFAYDNLQLGQMTILLLWGSMETLYLFGKEKKLLAAAALALIINIKIIPVAILAIFIYKGEFKTVFFCLIFLVVSLLLPGFVIGFEFNFQLLHDWQKSIMATSGNSLMDDYGRQSLSSFIPALLSNTPIQFELKRNMIELSPAIVNGIINGVRVALVILVAVILGKPFAGINNKHQGFYAWALVCGLTPLFFPHQGKYAFFYLWPAYVLVIRHLLHIGKNRIQTKHLLLPVLSCILLTFTTDGLIGRHLSDLCEYLNFITIGCVALLCQLLIFKKAIVQEAAES